DSTIPRRRASVRASKASARPRSVEVACAAATAAPCDASGRGGTLLMLKLSRHFPEHGAAAYHAPLGGGIVGGRAMHHAAVVPEQQLVGLPVMLVGEVGVDGERV